MNFLSDLSNVPSMLHGGNYIQLRVITQCADNPGKYQCATTVGGMVNVLFRGGTPASIPNDAVLSVWDFVGESSADGQVTIPIELGGSCRWAWRTEKSGNESVKPSVGELCAGLGGWSHGMKPLKLESKIMVEKHHDVAVACAKSFDIPLVTLDEAYKMIVSGSVLGPCVLEADIYDKRTWTVISYFQLDILCLSAPCQPWSKASTQTGLAMMDGRVTPFVFYMAKVVGIRVVNLENVSAIQTHPHFLDLIKFIRLQGFQIAHSGSYEVFPLLPIKRERWLATFHHQSIQVPPYVREGAEKVKYPRIGFGISYIGARDCVQKHISEREREDLKPCVDAILALSDPKLLPAGFERHYSQDVINSRTMNENNPIGGAMASYGSKHKIPRSLLEQRGLFTALFKAEGSDENPRYFTPWEFIASMYWPKGTKLPFDINEAWRAAGNAITIPHVVLCLYKMHGALRDFSPLGNIFINLKQMLQVVDDCRIKLSNVKQVVFQTRSLVECTEDDSHFVESPPGVQKIINHSPVVSPNVEQRRSNPFMRVHGLNDMHQHVEQNGVISKYESETPNVVRAKDPETVNPTLQDVSSEEGAGVMDKTGQSTDKIRSFAQNRMKVTETHHESKDDTPRKSLGMMFDDAADSNGDRRVFKKRPFHSEDTWCFNLGDHDKFVGKHDENQCEAEFQSFPMVDMMDTLRQALKHSGIGSIWPMSRVVMCVNPITGWSQTSVVPHHFTVIEIIRVFVRHAMPADFRSVKVNGKQVLPSSIVPGLTEAIVAFVPVQFSCEVKLTDGKEHVIIGDITTTIMDIKCRLFEVVSLHPDGIDILHDDEKIEAWKFVATFPNKNFRVAKVTKVILPMEIPVVPIVPQEMIPPVHSDLSILSEEGKIRFAARHPVWSSVRSVVCSGQECFDDMIQKLFPDIKTHCVIKVGTCMKEIPGKMQLKHVALNGDYEIIFDSPKPYPVTKLEVLAVTSIVEQMKIGTKEVVPCNERVERWIRSPFQSKAYPKIFSCHLTLTRLAAMYFGHSESKQGLLTLINGKCCDPRTTLGEIRQQDVITIRSCPLVGGAKEKDKDVRNMLSTQLSSRGVPVDMVESRVEAIMAVVAAEKFRTHIAESTPRQWVSIKALANEARFRLITTEELKNFQNRKKDNKPLDSKSDTASSALGSSVSTRATSADVKKLSLDEIQIDLTYFRTDAGAVKQLSQESFGPDAEGIAIMHAESAKKYPVCRLSPTHLAIIAVGKALHDHEVHLAPAINGRGQAILVPVCIYNYGDEEVRLNVGTNRVDLNTEDALVVEFTILKGEVDNWDSVKSPLVYIGQSITETKNAKIMSSWAVKAFGKDKKPIDHSKAEYIHGFIRILESKADILLARSGWAGIYLVPKNANKKPHEAYTIVHVPNKDIDEMKALAQSTKHALGIVRTSQGLALRSRREHAYSIKKAVFPELPLVEEGAFQTGDRMFILRHLQAHTSTDQLSSALQKLGWEGAKALKPIGPDAWSVAAPEKPPTPHLCINQQFVVVTEQGFQGKTSSVAAPKIPPSAAFVVSHAGTDSASPVVARFDELKAELQGQVKAMVEEKIGETNKKVQGIQESVEKTKNTTEEIQVAQQATDAKVKDVEVSVNNSSQNILTQITNMISSLQNGLNVRLDKLEANTSEKEAKRQRQT